MTLEQHKRRAEALANEYNRNVAAMEGIYKTLRDAQRDGDTDDALFYQWQYQRLQEANDILRRDIMAICYEHKRLDLWYTGTTKIAIREVTK